MRRTKTAQNIEASLSSDQLAALGKAFWRIADHYKLTREEQATLLGVKPNRARLQTMEKAGVIPEDQDKAYRVGLLVGIHKNLRILYPNNREIVYEWMKIPRDIFNKRTALEFIADGPDGLARLFTVRRYLDIARVG